MTNEQVLFGVVSCQTKHTINQLIESHIPLANRIASIRKRTVPRCVQFDELQAAAYYGLVDAAHKYEEEQCDTFAGYASLRIHGAIGDYLRQLSWGKKKALKKFMPLLMEDYPCERQATSSELFYKIAKELSPQYSQVIMAYYAKGKTQEQIGEEIGLSKARICQITQEAFNEIRAKWQEEQLWNEVA